MLIAEILEYTNKIKTISSVQFSHSVVSDYL